MGIINKKGKADRREMVLSQILVVPYKTMQVVIFRDFLTHLRDFYLPKLLILRPHLFFRQKIPLRSMVFFLSLL